MQHAHSDAGKVRCGGKINKDMVLSILFDGQQRDYHFNEGVYIALLCLNLVRIGKMDLKTEGEWMLQPGVVQRDDEIWRRKKWEGKKGHTKKC